jgi:hypothetical protein
MDATASVILRVAMEAKTNPLGWKASDSECGMLAGDGERNF